MHLILVSDDICLVDSANMMTFTDVSGHSSSVVLHQCTAGKKAVFVYFKSFDLKESYRKFVSLISKIEFVLIQK